MFDSLGAGLAVNDLDNDGRLDIVLANLGGANAVFWNDGQLRFLKETFPHGDSRAVSIVDVDGDGWMDVIFTRRQDPPTFWMNQGVTNRRRFSRLDAPDITGLAYAMSWADLSGDDTLDFVTASYDAALTEGSGFSVHTEGGVYFYENRGDEWAATRLAYTAQALAVLFVDLNGDDRLDIIVGNDFSVEDRIWLRQRGGWQEVQLFAASTRHTMSLDSGDINNDGIFEVFATDMKPYATSGETFAAWQPLLERMPANEDGQQFDGLDLAADRDPQIIENVLQMRDENGTFENRAVEAGLSATGWSWSGKFGDLDNDGFLDVYVVNGMVDGELFGQLPNNELVEENQAFRNDGAGRFVPRMDWGLGTTSGGRGMSMADLDNDGDLDVVVNNFLTPAQLFENRLCGGSSLEVDLEWPRSGNTRALGALVILRTSGGEYYRDVRATGGYLSGDPTRVHFGFPAGTKIEQLDIHWPDGASSSVKSLSPGALLSIRRD